MPCSKKLSKRLATSSTVPLVSRMQMKARMTRADIQGTGEILSPLFNQTLEGEQGIVYIVPGFWDVCF